MADVSQASPQTAPRGGRGRGERGRGLGRGRGRGRDGRGRDGRRSGRSAEGEVKQDTSTPVEAPSTSSPRTDSNENAPPQGVISSYWVN
jgi:hypothetical protein